MSEPTPLDYAESPGRGRRRGRFAIVAIVALVIGAGVYWREPLGHHVRLWQYQQRCLNYTRPPGTPVMTTQPVASDADYTPARAGGVSAPPRYLLDPVCWQRFETERRDRIWGTQNTILGGLLISFLHERVSAAGHRRLIYVASMDANALRLVQGFEARVIDPAAPWGEPREIGDVLLFQLSGRYVEATLFFGQPDPADPSHFTIDFAVDENRRGVIDGWLRDDDTVDFKLRDPATTRGL